VAKRSPPNVVFLLQEHVRIGRAEVWQRIPNESSHTLLAALERRDELIGLASSVNTFKERLRRLRGWSTKIRVVDVDCEIYDYPQPKAKK